MNTSKRQFLRAAATLSAVTTGSVGLAGAGSLSISLAGLSALAGHSAAQAAGSDYRALVCVYLQGGNDAHNWIVPVDATSYASYSQARGTLALAPSQLRALSAAPQQAGGRQFAMPRELDPLRELYERGNLAVVANVGPLLQPTTKAQALAGQNLPPKLFSHNDQASVWQSMAPEGAASGWGGRLADALMDTNGQPSLTCISAHGQAVFLTGARAMPYQVTDHGAVAIGGLQQAATLGSRTVSAVLRRTQADQGRHVFQGDYAKVVGRSMAAQAVLSTAIATQPLAPLPSTPITLADGSQFGLHQIPLARQLRSVAQMIAIHPALGMRRQVFMVGIPGFDTHQNQLSEHSRLSAHLAHSVAYFMGEMARQGLAEQVTLFTASDFGRTLTTNGSGSDHGWGSHHLVVGGAVRGRDIHGRFPTVALGSPDDLGSGRLLPSVSVSQYAGALGRWLGVPASDLATALPTLDRFDQNSLRVV